MVERGRTIAVLVLILAMVFLCACAGGTGVEGSYDAAYESQAITVEGLPGGTALITVAELRGLPQHELDASYQRTTGMTESFHMRGPYLSEVIEALGGDLADYAGVGVVGQDAYYCLVSGEVIASTPDLMLALTIDGEAVLDEDTAPARLAVQGQFGPYWVKMVERLVLYEEVPQKEITSVWAFDSLIEGIEPYMYEYYGSKDASIELAQIFSRFDYVDSHAFFTMKSVDGFKKNEVVNMVKSRYYIKYEGADAPTNISPYIKLGMNVHNIAWFSTNADAAVFLGEMIKYMDTESIGGQSGVPLNEALYEVEVKSLHGKVFEVLGTEGEKTTVPGEDLSKGVLAPGPDGSIRVLWQPGSGYEDIESLLRIRMAVDAASQQESEAGEVVQEEEPASGTGLYSVNGTDTVLTIGGDGVAKELFFTLDDLKEMKAGYAEYVYSTLNNWPTKSFAVAKGVGLDYLFELAGIKPSAKSVKVEAADGYYANFTVEQATGPQYCYPGIKSGSAAGAVRVKPVIAWASKIDSDDPEQAREDDLRFFIGQDSIGSTNTAAMVNKAARITVSTASPGMWPEPMLSFQEGHITAGHDFLDQVKIHYTTDGSEPTLDSPVYNPSTTYFQPQLALPIEVGPGIVVKAYAAGFGRYDSGVAECAVPKATEYAAPEAAGENPFIFLFMSDTQADPQTGDYSGFEALLKIALSKAPKPSLLLLGGDTVNDGADESEWRDFFQAVGASLDGLHVAAAAGNHDSSKNLTGKFEWPKSAPQMPYQGCFYSFDMGGVHFTVLDSNIMGAGNDEDVEWLKEDLCSKAAREANWRVAVCHHPFWPVADIPKDIARAKTMQERFLPALEEHGVDLLLVGHQHVYSRCAKAHGPVQVMAASGGKESYAPAGQPYIVTTADAPNFVRVSAGAETLAITACDAAGGTIEAFELFKKRD